MRMARLYKTRKRLLCALWLLGGCLVFCINGYGFMALYDDPIPQPSMDVQTARIKYSRLSATLSAPSISVNDKIMGLYSDRYGRQKATETADKPKPMSVKKPRSAQPVRLPELSGILGIDKKDGTVTYVAVLNGAPHVAADLISGFQIEKIYEKKVILKRWNRHWTLNLPDVKYSVSHE